MIMKKLLILLCLFSLAVNAQEVPHLGETLDVSIVNVDVFVTDRAGKRVRGLTGDDFEIYENGVRQEISNFAEYAEADERVGLEGTAAAADDQAAPRERRTMLIFFERMRLPNFAAKPLVKQIREIVHRTIGPEDAVSVVVWSRYGGTKHTEFTSDRKTIDATLDYVEKELQTAQIDLTDALREEAAMVRQFEQDAGAHGGSQTNTSVTLPMLVAYGEMKVRVNAINSAINTMAGNEGKKVMLLATRRLGAVAGAEFAHAAGSQDLSYDLRQRFGTEQLMESLTDMANASGVTVYPLYPLGVGSAMPDASTSNPRTEAAEFLTFQNEAQSQQVIAQRTGGLAAASTHDVLELLPHIADDITDYYSLAYRITPTGKDAAREIVVKTKNPELRVRSRRQFVEKSDETRMRDRLRASFFRAGQEAPQIDIDAKVGRKKRRGNTTIPLQVRIPIKDLTMLPQAGGKHAGSFSVYVGAATDLDELSDITLKTQPFEVKESQLAAAQRGYFTYDLDVKVNGKAKYVAVGVLDEVGRSYGLLRLDLENVK
jgi:VWFA-related protein